MARKDQTGDAAPLVMGRIGDRPYWVLGLSILLRALHQLAAAVFLAGYLFPETIPPSRHYLVLLGFSGVALLFTEWLRHRELYRELTGLSTLAKLLLFGLAIHGVLPLQPTVVFVFLLASVCSHAPKRIRHRLLY